MGKYIQIVTLFVCFTAMVQADSVAETTIENCPQTLNEFGDRLKQPTQIAGNTPADCIQLPIICTRDSDCTCSWCCDPLEDGGLSLCKPSCMAHHDLINNDVQSERGQ